MKFPTGLPRIPKRRRDTHKGDYGRVMVVAGSTGMAGAAVLASEAAYRSGAGLVHLFTPRSVAPVVARRMTCTVIHPVDVRRALGPLIEFARDCDVAAIGPGLSQNPDTVKLVQQVIPRLKIPMVLDADALNALAQRPAILSRPHAPTVLTPHPGEMARLLGVPTRTIQKDRRRYAIEAAKKFHAIVVLKGAGTLVTDGARVTVNPTGNPGMATGGSGDVLTGVIAALIGQKFTPYDAARLGVFLHGLAGDIAARTTGETSLMATDILAALPKAFQTHARTR